MNLGTVKNSTKQTTFAPDNRSALVVGKDKKQNSELLKKLCLDEISKNNSVIFIDPSEESVAEILDKIPVHRQDDVLYINPTLQPFALNPLYGASSEDHPLLASTLTNSLINTNFTPYRENTFRTYFRYGIQTLLSIPGSNIFSLLKLLTDDAYRTRTLRKLRDPVLKAFWNRYGEMEVKEQMLAIESTLALLDDLMLEPLVRNCLGQKTNKLVFKDKIVLVSLNESELGSENTKILGDLILSLLYMAGVRKVETNLYIDGAHRFGSAILGKVLASCPSIVSFLSVQFLHQFKKDFIPAILGTVGMIVAFKTSVTDHKLLNAEFGLKDGQTLLFEQAPGEATVAMDGTVTAIEVWGHAYPDTLQADTIVARNKQRSTEKLESIEKRIGSLFSE